MNRTRNCKTFVFAEKKTENMIWTFQCRHFNTDKASISNAVSLKLLYKQDRLSYLSIPEIWRLLLSFCIQKLISLLLENTSGRGALELRLKLNASYKDFPLPQIRGGREIRSAESPDDFPLSSNWVSKCENWDQRMCIWGPGMESWG